LIKNKISIDGTTLGYWHNGNMPRLLIHSGTHGDEYEVVDLVSKYIEAHANELPDFLYVPQVSPSAILLRTRNNLRGDDLNRIFMKGSEDQEVKTNMKLLSGKRFELFVTFHEDPVEERFYIYDCGLGEKSLTQEILNNLLVKVEGLGVELLNGVDDPDDPRLGFEFVGGYRYFDCNDISEDSGMIEYWLLNRQIVTICWCVEVPGLLPVEKKREIVELVMAEVRKYFLSHQTVVLMGSELK
jgi:hypothetical protein